MQRERQRAAWWMLLSVSLASTMVASERSPAEAIRGVWQVDKKSMMQDSPEYKKASAEQKKQMELALFLAPDVTLEIRADSITFTAVGDPPEAKSYTVKSVKGAVVTVKTTDKEMSVEEMKFELVTPKLLRVLNGDDTLFLMATRSE